MVSLIILKTELTSIVNKLAKAVVAEIFAASPNFALFQQNPESEVSYCGS